MAVDVEYNIKWFILRFYNCSLLYEKTVLCCLINDDVRGSEPIVSRCGAYPTG